MLTSQAPQPIRNNGALEAMRLTAWAPAGEINKLPMPETPEDGPIYVKSLFVVNATATAALAAEAQHKAHAKSEGEKRDRQEPRALQEPTKRRRGPFSNSWRRY